MMELHVWGPGFDLPSIDPECLAAITYLSIYLSPASWKLVQSSDPGISPDRALPALNHNSSWICGYDAITRHLGSDESVATKNIPFLSPLESANSVAYGSFIRQHGAPLLALSLYVSSANWVGVTRPLYSRILTFPLPWTIPLGLRSRAHSTAAHLNLSSLDTDTTQKKDDKTPFHNSSGTLQSLRSRLHAVTRSLTPDMRSHIRLDSLASDLFTPLEAMLKSTNMGKTFIVMGGYPTALDCLAYGYLALMLFPELPRRFLSHKMSREHKDLVRFTNMMRNISHKGGKLPIAKYSSPMPRIFARFLDSMVDVIPGIGDAYMRWKRISAEARLLGTEIAGLEVYDILHLAGQISIAAVLGVTAAAYKGMLGTGPGPAGHAPWLRLGEGLAKHGEAGQMFDIAFGAL